MRKSKTISIDTDNGIFEFELDQHNSLKISYKTNGELDATYHEDSTSLTPFDKKELADFILQDIGGN